MQAVVQTFPRERAGYALIEVGNARRSPGAARARGSGPLPASGDRLRGDDRCGERTSSPSRMNRNPVVFVVIHTMPSSHTPRGGTSVSVDPSGYVISAGDEVEDVDLELEELRLADGCRLTPELAEKLARERVAEARQRNLIPGGKSLSGDGSHSPRVQFRVPESLRAAAEAKAAAEGVSLSAVVRQALARYLA